MGNKMLKLFILSCIQELNGREKMAIPPPEEEYSDEQLEDEVSEERDYRAEYDNYHKKPSQRRNNDKRKQARRNMTYAGKVKPGDGKDVDHKNPLRSGGGNDDSNLRVRSVKSNRSDNGQGK
jgi:5-methylcytosine-specific restriction endonuclease McrA